MPGLPAGIASPKVSWSTRENKETQMKEWVWNEPQLNLFSLRPRSRGSWKMFPASSLHVVTRLMAAFSSWAVYMHLCESGVVVLSAVMMMGRGVRLSNRSWPATPSSREHSRYHVPAKIYLCSALFVQDQLIHKLNSLCLKSTVHNRF